MAERPRFPEIDPDLGLNIPASPEPASPEPGSLESTRRRRPVAPKLESTPPSSPRSTVETPTGPSREEQDSANRAISMALGKTQRRVRPTPPVLGAIGPIGQVQTLGDLSTQRKLRVAQRRREKAGQISSTGERIEIGADSGTDIGTKIRRAYAEVPVFGGLQRGFERGVTGTISTIRGATELLGDLDRYLSGGSSPRTRLDDEGFPTADFRTPTPDRELDDSGNPIRTPENIFYRVADFLSTIEEEDRKTLEKVALDPDLNIGRPSLVEPLSEFVGEAIPGAAKTIGLASLTGGNIPAAMGLMAMFDARAQGVTDPTRLVNAGIAGAASGAVAGRLNKLPLGPTRLAAQAAAGVGQELAVNQATKRPNDAGGLFSSALSNVAFDLMMPNASPQQKATRSSPGVEPGSASTPASAEFSLKTDPSSSPGANWETLPPALAPDGSLVQMAVPPPNSGIFSEIPVKLSPEIQRDPVPWYYSNLERAVESKFPNKLSPEQAAAMLSPTNPKYGIKLEEYEYSGLDELLAKKAVLGEPITKGEILDTIRQNQISLTETVLSELGTPEAIQLTPDPNTPGQFGGSNGRLSVSVKSDPVYGFEISLIDKKTGQTSTSTARSIESVYEYLDRYSKGTTDQAQYPSYRVIPGGTPGSYRELLLQLPETPDQSGFAVGGHFAGHRNILAHLRFDEGFDAQGNRVLQLQEIQSDLHQAGRERGYLPKPGEPIDPSDPFIFAKDMVPDAPFKNSWVDLAMKRLVRYAAENGYDKILLPTGDSVVSRFSDSVKSGEGHKLLYDQKIPQFARDISRKFGGKFSEEMTPAAENQVPDSRSIDEAVGTQTIRQRPDGRYEAVDPDGFGYETQSEGFAVADTPEGVQQMLARDREILGASFSTPAQKVYSLEIPQKLRSSVLYDGQKLFSNSFLNPESYRQLGSDLLEFVRTKVPGGEALLRALRGSSGAPAPSRSIDELLSNPDLDAIFAKKTKLRGYAEPGSEGRDFSRMPESLKQGWLKRAKSDQAAQALRETTEQNQSPRLVGNEENPNRSRLQGYAAPGEEGFDVSKIPESLRRGLARRQSQDDATINLDRTIAQNQSPRLAGNDESPFQTRLKGYAAPGQAGSDISNLPENLRQSFLAQNENARAQDRAQILRENQITRTSQASQDDPDQPRSRLVGYGRAEDQAPVVSPKLPPNMRKYWISRAIRDAMAQEEAQGTLSNVNTNARVSSPSIPGSPGGGTKLSSNPMFDPEAYRQMFSPEGLASMEEKARARGREIILTTSSRNSAMEELPRLKQQMLSLSPTSDEFLNLASRYTRLSEAIADSDGIESIKDLNSLYGQVWKIAQGNIEGAREIWNQLGMGESGGAGPGVDPGSTTGGSSSLSVNPMFDPENYRKLFSIFSRRSADSAQSQEALRAGQAEIDSRRSPTQTTASAVIQSSTALADAQLRDASIEYSRAKLARKEARDRLKTLQTLQGSPEYLNPERSSQLSAAIAQAQAAYDATAPRASQAYQRFKGAREARADLIESQIRERATAALDNPDTPQYRIDPETPYTEEIQNIAVTRPFLRFAKDTLNAQGVALDPDQLVSDQLVLLGIQGKLPPLPQLIPILEKNGISFEQFLTDMRGAASRAGSILEPLSKMRRAAQYLAQQKLLPPQYAKALSLQLPKLSEITPFLRERSYLQRFVGLYQGVITSMFRTAMNNLGTAGIRTGLDSMGQVFDSALQNLGGRYMGFGAQNKIPLSPALAIRPMLMLISEAFSQPITGARKRLVRTLGGDPSQIRDTKANRLFAAIEAAYPRETFPVGEIALNADLTTGDARLMLLNQFKTQAQAYPGDTKTKAKVLATIDRALAVAQRDQRLLSRTFSGAENLVSIMTWANLAQERIARRAIFEAKLRRYATEAGIDLDGAIESGTVAQSLPVDLVTRAGDEALRITYGKRRISYPMMGSEVFDAAVKLGGFPLPNFMVNFFIDQLENSPAGVLRYLSAREREKVSKGDLRGLWQPLTSLAIYGIASQLRSQYYDSQGATDQGAEERNLVDKATRAVGGVLAPTLPAAGPNYYNLRIGGQDVDLRSTQFGATFFLADLIERQRRGLIDLDAVTFADLGKNLIGLDMRSAGTAADAITETIQAMQDGIAREKAEDLAGKYVGGQLASWLTPLTQISDLIAQFSDEEAKKRETFPGGFSETVQAQLQNRVPVLRQSLPEYQSPTRSEAPRKSTPLLTQLTGIPTTEGLTFLEKELSLTGLKPKLPSSGDPKIDARARAILGDLLQKHSERIAARPGYLDRPPHKRGMVLDSLIQKYSIAAFKLALSESPNKYASRALREKLNKRLRISINVDRARRGLKPIEDIFDTGWMLEDSNDEGDK